MALFFAAAAAQVAISYDSSDDDEDQLTVARVYRDRTDPLMESDKHILEKYRLPRYLIIKLADKLDSHLRYSSRRNHALLPVQQLLLALRYFSTGIFFHVIGDTMQVMLVTVLLW